jgi:fructuronate reductase
VAHPKQPRSALGLLTAALHDRRRQRVPAPTILSCDNLPQNGATLRGALVEFASLLDPSLAEWIERSVNSPSTVVDRIVPATTSDDITRATNLLRLRDEGLVLAEVYSQWVIEDRFLEDRPAFEKVGAQLVNDVRGFESAKLRLLNGSHSTLAYLGSLAGFTYVHEAMADADFRELTRRLMAEELAPTLGSVAGLDIGSYQAALLRRFSNTAVRHRLRQIATDGSQKLPQRLLEPLRVRHRRKQSFNLIALAIAGWMRFVMQCDASGRPYAVDDPLASRLASIATQVGAAADQAVIALLGFSELFPHELADDPGLRATLTRQFESLTAYGARATVRNMLRESCGERSL